MAYWKVETRDKKNVEEHQLWQKDDMVIRRITGFRWGKWTVETNNDEKPVLNQTDGPDGDAIDMYNYCDENVDNIELDLLEDSWYSDTIWPDDMDEEESERLEELWEEESYSGWEREGWNQYETECWSRGPLDIKEDE